MSDLPTQLTLDDINTVKNPQFQNILEELGLIGNGVGQYGPGATIYYSFLDVYPDDVDDNQNDIFVNTFSQFSEEQKTAVKEIFAILELYLNINFVDLAEFTPEPGQEKPEPMISFGNANIKDAYGETFLNKDRNITGILHQYVFIDLTDVDNNDPAFGTDHYETIMHGKDRGQVLNLELSI